MGGSFRKGIPPVTIQLGIPWIHLLGPWGPGARNQSLRPGASPWQHRFMGGTHWDNRDFLSHESSPIAGGFVMDNP